MPSLKENVVNQIYLSELFLTTNQFFLNMMIHKLANWINHKLSGIIYIKHQLINPDTKGTKFYLFSI